MAKKIKVKTEKSQFLKDVDIALQYYQSGNLQQAEAIALRPDYAEAYNNLGLALENNNLVGESILSYLQIARCSGLFIAKGIRAGTAKRRS